MIVRMDRITKRIALAGVGGVGKTSLASDLSRILQLPVISETIRTSANDLKIKDISKITDNERLILQTLSMSRQRTLEGVYHSGFVSDRSVFDILFYTESFFEDKSIRERFRNMCNGAYYTHIIFVPPFSERTEGERLGEDDGFRLDSSFQKNEKYVENKLCSVRTHVLESIDYEERLQECISLIGN